MSDTGFTPISKEEAAAAATAQAFTCTDEDGNPERTIVHSVMVSSSMMLGADWDLAALLEEIDKAKEIGWFDDFMGHELALITTDNRAYKFEIKRPVVS